MLSDFLTQIRLITFRRRGTAVERNVAALLASELCPRARVKEEETPSGEEPRLIVRVAGDAPQEPAGNDWLCLQVGPGPSGRLEASHAHWLFGLYCLVKEEWSGLDEQEFEHCKTVYPSFSWFRNLSDFFVGSLRHARGFDREDYVRQLARQGFSHVTINGLGTTRPFESGPPGDKYFWFYDYSPDLDQFVDSHLLHGYYPADYLQANLQALKGAAALARKYGLTPGLHINSPRSMPEEFWARHGFLRGARVDHPRETFRPRYTLAMAHPAVQNHYRELIRNLLREVPEIGFIHLWTNDSGSGFEFVTSLYAGRNGGPYLIREWKSEEEIARAAARNVLTYYRLLCDEGQRANPGFRLVCDLGPFYAERKHIIPGLGRGIDAGEFAYFESAASPEDLDHLAQSGAETHVKIDVSDNNVLGLPSPALVYERLQGLRERGNRFVLTGATPQSLAPYDINAEVLRAIQLQPERSLEQMLHLAATRWVGENSAEALTKIWMLSDSAVRSYPAGVPMSTFGFPWFRLWVRPFVPNIDAIPESERRYYEDFLLATFNNPARVDLNNDMMWNFLTVAEAGQKELAIDAGVLAPLDEAIRDCTNVVAGSTAVPLRESSKGEDAVHAVFADLRDRLVAGRCFYATMRNTLAWTESVHGFLEAPDDTGRESYRTLCREMVDHELANARELLRLWMESHVHFMPVSTIGETLHIYGENFGELLQRKIDLMQRHRNDEPFIDPNYMWRVPAGTK